MRIKICLCIPAIVLSALACTVEETELYDGITDESTLAADESGYEDGVAVVKFTEEMAALISDDLMSGNILTKSSDLNDLVSSYGIVSIERVFPDDERWIERQHREGLHRWYTVTFDGDTIPATKAADGLKAIPGVEIAEPSPRVKPVSSYYYNDQFYYLQWHLCGDYSINVEPVWTYYTKGSSDVIVAVVDGGIAQTHPDLADNCIPGGEGGSWNFYSNSATITADGHGSHVAGIISAVTNNGVGVAGIAGGDYKEGIAGTRLLSCQVFSGDDSATAASFAAAIEYGADNGALISQNSWDYSYESEEQAKAETTPSVMKEAIDYFVKYAGCDNDGNQLPDSKMKGGIVVFAAGNDGWTYGHPADYESCIAVGATDSDGLRANYSNYGDWVDICAPGSYIASTYYDNGPDYVYASGTSMACPMVSGVAALVIDYRGGQGFTADDLRDCLIKGADPYRVSATEVGPYLDALGAVLYGTVDPPSEIETYTAETSSNTIHFTWEVPAGDADGTRPALGAKLFASTERALIDRLDPSSPGSEVISASVSTNSMTIGAEAEGDLVVDRFNTVYYVTCASYNYGGVYADLSETKTVTTGGNNPPSIAADTDLTNIPVGTNKTVEVIFTIADPDGHKVNVEFNPASVAETLTKTSDDTYTLAIKGDAQDTDGSYVPAGTYSSTLSAIDEYGEETSLTIGYTIEENEPPYALKQFDNVLLFLGSTSTRSQVIDLEGYFADPDGDDLTYTIDNTSYTTVQAALGTSSGASVPQLFLTAMKQGTVTITVTVTDVRGNTCSLTFIVDSRLEGEYVKLYPVPVVDVLHVATGQDEESTEISVATSNGTVVYRGVATASAFNPADIDLGDIAPGTYSVKVKFGSTEETKQIVKI